MQIALGSVGLMGSHERHCLLQQTDKSAISEHAAAAGHSGVSALLSSVYTGRPLRFTSITAIRTGKKRHYALTTLGCWFL